jgi:hypothetical protein
MVGAAVWIVCAPQPASGQSLTPGVPSGGLPPGPIPTNAVTAATWTGQGSSIFDNAVLLLQEGRGAIGWCLSAYDRGDYGFLLSPRDPVAALLNLGLLQEFLGTGLALLPSEQAWQPSAEAGVTIPTARRNGPLDGKDGFGEFFPVVAASPSGARGFGYRLTDGVFASDGPAILNGWAGDASGLPSAEAAFDFAATWFPYAAGWTGGAVDNPDENGRARFLSPNAHSPDLLTTHIVWPEVEGLRGGTALLALPGASALEDGMIFATSAEGGDALKAISTAPTEAGWIVTARSTGEVDPSATAQNGAQFQFVYVPYDAPGLIGGYIGANGVPRKAVGDFQIARTGTGTYRFSIPGKSSMKGVLLLQTAALLEGHTDLAAPHYLSYQPDPAEGATAMVQAQMTDIDGLPKTSDVSFYVAWIDYETPLVAPDPASRIKVRLRSAASPAGLVVTWDSAAAGFTLERTSALGPDTVWTSVGVVGQAGLETNFTVSPSRDVEYFRLKK